jgi:hypothetical protein
MVGKLVRKAGVLSGQNETFAKVVVRDPFPAAADLVIPPTF